MFADPKWLLIALLAGCTGALAFALIRRTRRTTRLARLARATGWMFSPSDRFQLAERVAPLIPVPGAADVVVSDVLYRADPAGRSYIARVDFTVGTFSRRVRRTMVGRLS
ncbi:MAG TPA: hypothetical protein PKB10_01225, partial [Tepidisphaeraceae bacterium]|nr:hypothetical protein [Tepidisphaeraceae bacterium]